MDQYPLAKHFDEVADKIKTYGKNANMSNDDLLALYSLFKQAKEGDNITPQPSFYQLEAKAKWNAWNTQKGKSKEAAKHDYVQLALKYFPEDIRGNYA
jgi:diazepam-binding inhibitor (GABA receptor modulating acyl-CoA-binding protein)